MPDVNVASPRLSADAAKLVDAALAVQQESHQPTLTVWHWLEALITQNAELARAISGGIAIAILSAQAANRIREGDLSLVLSQEDVFKQASARAKSQAKFETGERDLAAVILKAAGYKVADAVSAIGAAIQAQIATAGWPKSQGSSTASTSAA
ncbi:MAG: hypothetical protein ACYCZF_18000, partial [Anaerolineae bacterium]